MWLALVIEESLGYINSRTRCIIFGTFRHCFESLEVDSATVILDSHEIFTLLTSDLVLCRFLLLHEFLLLFNGSFLNLFDVFHSSILSPFLGSDVIRVDVFIQILFQGLDLLLDLILILGTVLRLNVTNDLFNGLQVVGSL